jgi:hypothetical protein
VSATSRFRILQLTGGAKKGLAVSQHAAGAASKRRGPSRASELRILSQPFVSEATVKMRSFFAALRLRSERNDGD